MFILVSMASLLSVSLVGEREREELVMWMVSVLQHKTDKKTLPWDSDDGVQITSLYVGLTAPPVRIWFDDFLCVYVAAEQLYTLAKEKRFGM